MVPPMSDRDLIRRFPADFVWGVATASYQIEGAATEDGRAPSIWDAFSHTPGRVVNGDTGDVACDHYHRMPQDVALIRSLGVDAYRFSIAWPRVIPDGRGAVNAKGLDFYERLVDELLAAGIKPLATLYHWDLPIALHGRGGWTSRETPDAFADYADVVIRRLGDRLHGVATLNEPWCASYLSYLEGHHAPGERNLSAALAAVHMLNLAHGKAVTAIRAAAPTLPVGCVFNPMSVYPATERPADVAAAERSHAFHNGMFFGPVFAGAYPEGALAGLGDAMPEIREGDLAAIHQPLDFVGVNYYTPMRVVAAPEVGYPHARTIPPAGGVPVTDMGWEVYAPAFGAIIRRLASDYRLPPVVITENGAACRDAKENGAVYDPDRIDYYRLHIAEIARLIEEGIDVRGYYAWSLMDNFEWAFGYAKRFGLVHVDYATQERTIKASGLWYRDLIAGR